MESRTDCLASSIGSDHEVKSIQACNKMTNALFTAIATAVL